MRPGTPAFVGARLKEAREARGISAVSLANMLGVSRQAVSQYEHGSVTPHPEVMRKISSLLSLPYEFFWQPPRCAPGKVFFGTTAKTEKIRGNWRLQWLKDICGYLEEFVEFPLANIPDYDVPDDLKKIDHQLINDISRDLRRHWGLGTGAVNNMVRVLEKNGVIVAKGQTGAESVDAFSCCEESQRPCMVLGSGSSAELRYDAGRQLGHIILHRKIDKDVLCGSADHKLAEEQASYFAGAFLLPEESFVKDCGQVTLESLRMLKAKWRLPIEVMLQRAKQIGLCTEEQAKLLWKSYSRRGWKEKEPLDDELQIEEPRLLCQSFELIVENQIQSCNDILCCLPISQTDIEDLAGLPAGFLEDSPLLVRLTGKASSEVKEKEHS